MKCGVINSAKLGTVFCGPELMSVLQSRALMMEPEVACAIHWSWIRVRGRINSLINKGNFI